MTEIQRKLLQILKSTLRKRKNNAALFLPVCVYGRSSVCVSFGCCWTPNHERISQRATRKLNHNFGFQCVCLCVCAFAGSPESSFEGIRKRRRQPCNSNPTRHIFGPSRCVCETFGYKQPTWRKLAITDNASPAL